MPELVNTSVLEIEAAGAQEEIDDRPVMIDVDHVSMVFNMASENLTNLKEYAIKLAKGQLYFEKFTALDDITFQVRKGDVYGIMGTNGSGKSTLLKIIAGVLEPTKGSCSLNGSIAPLIELGAGFDPELSARENIYLNGALLGYSRDFIDQHFDEIVDFAEIEKFLDMPLKNYSSGMISRIAFAIATVIVPEILLVDEVLSVGDFMFQRKCERRITELIEHHGVTVLIVSHSNDQIARLCNKCIWIEKGHTRIMGEASLISSIYGTLGGRLGSGESEHRVFSALKDQLAQENGVGINNVCEIEYQNQAQSCVALAQRGWKAAPDTVILASGHTHIASELATPLAHALGAPVLPWNFEEAPVGSAFYLQTVKPARIIAIDCRKPGDDTNVSSAAFEWAPEVVVFRHLLVHDLSQEIYAYGQSLGLWGNTAVVVDFMDNGIAGLAIGTAAAYLKAPILARGDDVPVTFDEVAARLAQDGFNRVIVTGPTTPESMAASFANAGLDVQYRCRDHGTAGVFDFQLEALGANTSPAELVAAATADEQWPRQFGLPAYAAHVGAVILHENTEDLNSVASALDYCEQAQRATSLLWLRGTGLEESDVELLASQLAK